MKPLSKTFQERGTLENIIFIASFQDMLSVKVEHVITLNRIRINTRVICRYMSYRLWVH
jgi:hypothetical protein